MKKFVKFLPILLVALMGSAMLWSCSDDKDEPINTNSLPDRAKNFLATYFPTSSVVMTIKDKDNYDVTLADGTQIEFDRSGEWTDVDAVMGKTIPSGFYPQGIDTYVTSTFPGIGINEISKEKRGFDVQLVTGTEMLFGSDGTFISYDLD